MGGFNKGTSGGTLTNNGDGTATLTIGGTTVVLAQTSLLGPLATVVPTGTADSSTFYRADGTYARIPATYLFSGGDAAEIEASGQQPPTPYAISNWSVGLSCNSAPTVSALTVQFRYFSGGIWNVLTTLSIPAGSTTTVTASVTQLVPAGSIPGINVTSVGTVPAGGAVAYMSGV